MKLTEISPDHLPELMSWFPDRRSCAVWGGPSQRYPFTAATFHEDAKLDQVPSCSLVAEGGELLAFGQYYPRSGRCHLARLATAPRHRGRGLGAVLVRELCHRGCRSLEVDACSLFVMDDNLPALRLYEKLGFARAPFPAGAPDLEGCFFMIAALGTILAG